MKIFEKMPGTRDDEPNRPREVEVRTTRDGDHVLVTINFGKSIIKDLGQ